MVKLAPGDQTRAELIGASDAPTACIDHATRALLAGIRHDPKKTAILYTDIAHSNRYDPKPDRGEIAPERGVEAGAAHE
jgi:hypothetical protein